MCRFAVESKTVSFISIAYDVISCHQDEGVESPTHTKWEPPTIEHSIVPDDGDDQSLGWYAVVLVF